jgi:ABC-type uncharacterized transport system auxiliary subunit
MNHSFARALHRRAAAAFLLLGSALPGCALTSKSEAMVPRYFDLDQKAASAEARVKPNGDPTHRLRLGRIQASAHLDERLVFRSSTREIGYYEQQRWSEEPREYLRRALAREFYEHRGLTRVVSGPAPTLEVELSSFEEVRGPKPVARVRLTYILHDEQFVLVEHTLTVDHPLATTSTSNKAERPVAVVAAMSEALRSAVAQIADGTLQALPRAASNIPEQGPAQIPPGQPRPEALPSE